MRVMFNNNRGARRADERAPHPRAARPGHRVSEDRQALLHAIPQEVRDHVPCGFEICEQATNLVPGEGSATAKVVLVGEAPGASEDRTGRPFVGSAGQAA